MIFVGVSYGELHTVMSYNKNLLLWAGVTLDSWDVSSCEPHIKWVNRGKNGCGFKEMGVVPPPPPYS